MIRKVQKTSARNILTSEVGCSEIGLNRCGLSRHLYKMIRKIEREKKI